MKWLTTENPDSMLIPRSLPMSSFCEVENIVVDTNWEGVVRS